MNKRFSLNYSLYLGIVLVGVLFLLSIFGPELAPHTLMEILETHYQDGKVFAPPLEPFKSIEYPLGTDKWGYDLLTMVLHGIRHTIFISLAVTTIKMTIGTIVGVYVGAWKRTPGWMESFENSWSYVPLFLVLYFFLIPINFGSYSKTSSLIFYFIFITSAISIPSIISSVRKKSREISKSIFIEAARTLGASRHRIIWNHIFPQMKESLLIMFILEIVYVITIMGQLALMNIFIGGTIVRYDPLIYLSATKEIAGLVGQARGNLYGSIHVLIVPLVVLLLTTLSFSLLANGLKNRYQSTYQRTPWIKTGFEPKLIPIRKDYQKKSFGWSQSSGKPVFIMLLILLLSVGGYFQSIIAADNRNDFSSKAKGVENNNLANYELMVNMNKKAEFSTTADIVVKNFSDKKWDNLVFYFIPNAYKKGHNQETVKGYSELKISNIKVDGKKAAYTLEHDTLNIKLDKQMKKRDQAKVEITYQFTLPHEGSRFTRVNDHFYLAQWYPMLATFQNGKWNKEDYQAGFKTWHTDFSDYLIHYDIPKGYSIVSTADKDAELKETEGTLEIKRVRDFFMAIEKDMKLYTTTKNGVEIRLFSKNLPNQDPKEILKIAENALGFFQEKIGKFPRKQFDIILDESNNNAYPGIVTIDPDSHQVGPIKNQIVQGIAHQYFYGVVANDPYHEPWIDEGMSEFATNIYLYLGEEQGIYRAQAISHDRMFNIKDRGLGRQFSNVPIDEIKHPGFVLSQPALQLFSMVQEKYPVQQKDFTVVLTEYLSDYYHHFQYKEVNTSEFIRFTKDYFQIPTGYFNEWLDTSEIHY
jgi:ABC-type dipeptide/oligopeptide/nickel transport system permease subunit